MVHEKSNTPLLDDLSFCIISGNDEAKIRLNQVNNLYNKMVLCSLAQTRSSVVDSRKNRANDDTSIKFGISVLQGFLIKSARLAI